MATNSSHFAHRTITDARPPEAPEDERTRLLRGAFSVAAAVCGGLAVLFFIFAALGQINVGNAAIATVVALALTAVWVAGLIYNRRHTDRLALRHDRERRGF